MKTTISAITSSGTPTIGNYVGSLRHWANQQHNSNSYFFVANLHAITVRQDANKLHSKTLDNFAWLIACGIDPRQSTIFIQSQIPAHSELAWILSNYTTIGELSRMTQYKNKIERYGPSGQLSGLFSYPVLMAADILLYGADSVPVGHDQIQHLELARTIAERFNGLYGPIFTVPQAEIAEYGARIMNLQDPSRKMSKSESDIGTVFLSDSPDEIRTKIKKATTDSENIIRLGADKPALTNLLHIYSAFAQISTEEAAKQYISTDNYGTFKNDLSELLVDKITTLQSKYNDIRSNSDNLNNLIELGRDKASAVANKKLALVKEKVGLF